MNSSAIHMLDSGLSVPLTLLVAPAGSGKTALLRSWAAARAAAGSPSLVWLTMHSRHNQPEHFLVDLAQALLPLRPLRLASPPQRAGLPPERSPAGLINAIADIPEDFSLVLDAYEKVNAAEVHGFVSLLLDYPPPALHLVIASRLQPPLPLARLRARRQLIEIGPADLL